MTPLAILFMLVALATVTGLAGWCYFKVLSGGKCGVGSTDRQPPDDD